ncbi:MAG: lytic transglycosylase domain-containing protein [Desulfobulbus sp.]|jgi:membrane-bound lytic murein transglycosylase D|uniref:lytic transglycosylase domain-containing protein n=1 Tax=Desulfobulbus sp. TaxID=895 RepID=UPI00283C3025|nr:lytic transglycosylase domain-containing protein [Desulfobulbus sp.]MDR2551519.1 lytic transglycosylase domain-containing protein [Desulfobulbus sp.]
MVAFHLLRSPQLVFAYALVAFYLSLTWSSAIVPVLAAEKFPLYPCLRTNVKFWENIYSRYSTRQGILHDTDDLGRVYAIVDLVDWESADAARINGERIKTAKDRINDILTRLGSGTPPRTAEERRIAGLFPPKQRAIYHEARENVRLQLGQSDRFYEGVVRSGKYLAQFKRIFAAQGLPPELAYLPHVESSFNPKAHSKAGAAGLWQFTRSTGKEYMTVNELIDERYDPFIATQAAAQLLKGNYEQLQTWPLALTAYNHGRTGMLRAVRQAGNYENIFRSYDQGSFKFASRNFYSEFLAAARVAIRMGKAPRFPFERPEETMTVRLAQDMPVNRLRTLYRVSADNFNRLNPALLSPVIKGEQAIPQSYQVRLPVASRGKVRPNRRSGRSIRT